VVEPVRVSIPGRPGPKGSLNPFCIRCAQKRLPQKIGVKEDSTVGAAFRKVIARAVKALSPVTRTEATQTVVTIYIERQKQVRGGVELETYVPSSMTPIPIAHQHGDIEKHVRTLHDALQDAGLLADDCVVSDLVARRRWATPEHPAGIEIEISDARL